MDRLLTLGSGDSGLHAGGFTDWVASLDGRVLGDYGEHRRGIGEMLACTPRQREILVHYASGRTDKEAAHQMGISVATVRRHMQRLYEVNDVRGRGQALTLFIIEAMSGAVLLGPMEPE